MELGADLRTQSYYEEGKSLTYTDTSKRLTKLKRDDDHQWLSSVSSVALQQKLRDLEQAFQNFFDGRTGYPNFKRKHGKQTARFASNAFTLYGKALSVAKVPGELNVRWSRDLSDTCNVTSVTLTKDPAGRYFVSLTCTEEKEPLPEADKTVGVDLGITDVVSPLTASRAATRSIWRMTCIASKERNVVSLAKRRKDLTPKTGRSKKHE